MSFNLKKNFRILGGTSVVTPELLRDDTSLTDTLNADMYDNFGLSKRRGEDLLVVDEGRTIAALTTSEGERLLIQSGTSNAILKILTDEVTVNYTGAAELKVEIEMDYQDSFNSKYIVAYEDNVEVLRVSLGNPENGNVDWGDVTASFFTVNINLTVPVARQGDQASSTPVFSQIITTENNTIPIQYTEEVTGPSISVISPKPFDFLERDGVIYFTSGNALWKYDGTEYYQASLPKPIPGTGFASGSGGPASSTPADGTYRYRVLYNYTDARGNVIYSAPSDELEITTNGTNTPFITPSSVPLVNYASSVTATILRTKEVGSGGGSIYYVVADSIPLNVQWNDNVADSTLTEDFVLPPLSLDAPTNGKYIDIWRNAIVMTGFENDPDKVLYEDVQFTEGFTELNGFLTQSRQGGENSGIKSQDNALYVFKEDSVTVVTGDLNTGQFQVDKISDEGIGAVSNNSIIESLGRIWFMSKEGIYSIGLQGLQEESGDLAPIFEKEFTTNVLRDTFGFNNTLDDRLLFCIPTLDNSGAKASETITYCYNIKLKKWFIWDTVDFSRGISIDDKEIWGAGSTDLPGSLFNTYYKNYPRTFTRVDFADYGAPINYESASNWETLGEPSVPKKFVRMKIYSIDNHRQKFETPDFKLDIETEHDYEYGITVSKNSLRFYELNGPGTERTPVISRRTRLRPKKARSLRYLLKNSELNKNILVSGVEFEIATEHSGYMRSE